MAPTVFIMLDLSLGTTVQQQLLIVLDLSLGPPLVQLNLLRCRLAGVGSGCGWCGC
jgi:hypothetical protein